MSAPPNSSAAAAGLGSAAPSGRGRVPTKAQLQEKNLELEAENTGLQGRIAELQQKLEQEAEERERLRVQEYERLANVEEPESPEIIEEKSREEAARGADNHRSRVEAASEREPN